MKDDEDEVDRLARQADRFARAPKEEKIRRPTARDAVIPPPEAAPAKRAKVEPAPDTGRGGAAGAPENVEVNEPNANDLAAEDEIIQEGLFGPDSDDEADDAAETPP